MMDMYFMSLKLIYLHITTPYSIQINTSNLHYMGWVPLLYIWQQIIDAVTLHAYWQNINTNFINEPIFD